MKSKLNTNFLSAGNFWTKGGVVILLMVFLTGNFGCEEKKPKIKTRDVSGTIDSIDLSGQTIKVAYAEPDQAEKLFTVHITGETEIFINGSLAKLGDLKVGEQANGTVKVIKNQGANRYEAMSIRISRAEVITAPKKKNSEQKPPATKTGDEDK